MFTPTSSSITPMTISSRQFPLVRNKTRNGTMDVIRHPPEHLSRLSFNITELLSKSQFAEGTHAVERSEEFTTNSRQNAG